MPHWDNIAMKKQVFRDHKSNVSRFQCYRARLKAHKLIHGEYGAQYKRLWCYAAILRESNLGSTALLRLNEGFFHKMYVSLHACKKGFLDACRPIIALDGCFLKTSFGG